MQYRLYACFLEHILFCEQLLRGADHPSRFTFRCIIPAKGGEPPQAGENRKVILLILFKKSVGSQWIIFFPYVFCPPRCHFLQKGAV